MSRLNGVEYWPTGSLSNPFAVIQSRDDYNSFKHSLALIITEKIWILISYAL